MKWRLIETIMACGYSRNQIRDIVLGVYRGLLNDPTIVSASRFGAGKEIDIDDHARGMFAFPIKQSVDKVPDCIVTKLTPDKCKKAKTVGDVVDEICKEFKIT